MIPVSMQMIPAILIFIGVPFCIESPRWLISRGRKVRTLVTKRGKHVSCCRMRTNLEGMSRMKLSAA